MYIWPTNCVRFNLGLCKVWSRAWNPSRWRPNSLDVSPTLVLGVLLSLNGWSQRGFTEPMPVYGRAGARGASPTSNRHRLLSLCRTSRSKQAQDYSSCGAWCGRGRAFCLCGPDHMASRSALDGPTSALTRPPLPPAWPGSPLASRGALLAGACPSYRGIPHLLAAADGRSDPQRKSLSVVKHCGQFIWMTSASNVYVTGMVISEMLFSGIHVTATGSDKLFIPDNWTTKKEIFPGIHRKIWRDSQLFENSFCAMIIISGVIFTYFYSMCKIFTVNLIRIQILGP